MNKELYNVIKDGTSSFQKLAEIPMNEVWFNCSFQLLTAMIFLQNSEISYCCCEQKITDILKYLINEKTNLSFYSVCLV